jgi:phosphatidylethanolamine-binding protein (PEBP) family uncharacterized protein
MRLIVFLLLGVLLWGDELGLFSKAFKEKEIPREYACVELGGKNLAPEFTFNRLSGGFKLALIMDDETPPCKKGDGACIHWAIFNIPATIEKIDKFHLPKGITQGKNYKNEIGYAGPCPPSKHLYTATLYLLKPQTPNIPNGVKFTNFRRKALGFLTESAIKHKLKESAKAQEP